MCCCFFIPKRKGKPTHQLYLSSWNASMLMKRNINSLLLIMVYVKSSFASSFALLLSFMLSPISFNESCLSGLFHISSLYSLTNLHHALQHNFKFKELATRDTKFEDKGCGREDYYMNGSLNKSEQNTFSFIIRTNISFRDKIAKWTPSERRCNL